MRLLIILRHVCLYKSDPDFSCGRDRTDDRTEDRTEFQDGGMGQPEVVQEVLADLKSITFKIFDVDETVCA